MQTYMNFKKHTNSKFKRIDKNDKSLKETYNHYAF